MHKEISINWGAIETDYRAGVKSLRIIAGERGVTEGAVRKRSKRDMWVRDLHSKIKAKADDLIRKAVVRSVVRTESAISERVLVKVNAQVQTDVILAHRTDIARTRKLAMTLLEELEIATGDNAMLRDLAILMYSPDKNGVDKLGEIYQKVIAMPSRVDALKKVAETLRTLIALEREAFGIVDKDDGAGNNAIESVIKRVLEKHPRE